MKRGISIVFLIALLGIGMCHIVMPDTAISVSERRKLAAFPVVHMDRIWNGTFADDMETYLLDQFPLRDSLRKVQAQTEQKAFQMADVNGYYQIQDGIYEVADQTQEQYLQYAGVGFGKIAEQYFPEGNIYYSIIPDKNYFVAEQNGYPSMDYDKIEMIMQQNMKRQTLKSQYIDLFNVGLTMDDYYRTDLHWKQECLIPAAEYLIENMYDQKEHGLENKDVILQDTQEQVFDIAVATEAFAGAYLGASSFSVQPDTLFYLDNDLLRRCTVYDYEKKQEVSMYQYDKLESVDGYDFYLGGARALLRLDNPEQTDGRTLVLFRDSFGSSIAPLMLPYYKEIIMIDLRYVTMEYCQTQIALPRDADVLFLYNTSMLNHANSFRF